MEDVIINKFIKPRVVTKGGLSSNVVQNLSFGKNLVCKL